MHIRITEPDEICQVQTQYQEEVPLPPLYLINNNPPTTRINC